MTIHMPTNEEIEAYERLEANRWTCACGYSSLADPCSGCGKPRPAAVPDPLRVKAAFALLDLVEAGGRAGCDVLVSGFNGTVAVEDPVWAKWLTESYEDGDLGAACRRLLEDLRKESAS